MWLDLQDIPFKYKKGKIKLTDSKITIVDDEIKCKNVGQLLSVANFLIQKKINYKIIK